MYFEIENTIKIESIEQLMELTRKRKYGVPGHPYDFNKQLSNLSSDVINFQPSYETSGIFRGQSLDWELLPSSYRNKEYNLNEEQSDSIIAYRFLSDNREFQTFSENASQQNNTFPKSEIEQMIIAQHYGIRTPLLDWTRNIFVAVYFALDLRGNDDDDKNLEPFIYHIRDERLLDVELDKSTRIDEIKNSTLVSPLPIDRRVERQFSVFSFHPHPLLKTPKLPIDKYIISGDLFIQMWRLMDGMGFSSSHYFPDYAGLAERIKQGFMI